MFDKPASLRSFQPKFYTGGASRSYLALLYDAVALMKPARVAVAGSGDGQAFFTLCQAVRETGIKCECIATCVPRGDSAAEDPAWQAQQDYGSEFYADFARFLKPEADSTAGATAVGTVDLLLIDDVDRGAELDEIIRSWEPTLTSSSLVLLHGWRLERDDSLAEVWRRWAAARPEIRFNDGIGLALAAMRTIPLEMEMLFDQEQSGAAASLYSAVATRIEAQARVTAAERENAALRTRQIWLDSIVSTGWQAQEVMDSQARIIADLEQRFATLHADRAEAQKVMEAQSRKIDELLTERSRAELFAQSQAEQLERFEELRRDRARAQLVMDSQQEQVQRWIGVTHQLQAELDRVTAELKERKKLLKAAKAACSRNGKCFHISTGPKVQRSLGDKLMRELRRVPRNLGLVKPPPAKKRKDSASVEASVPPNAYAEWIAAHEPDAAAIEAQREAARELPVRPKLSVVVPVFNTPPQFLHEMIGSLVAQTYQEWELCIVDGGSNSAATIEALRRWAAEQPQVRVIHLPENLGISENTNRALEIATGEFVLLADHDDLLPPFAFFEMARAISAHPDADMFYSDEDRVGPDGRRHMPFFKPDWSPALLCSFMYTGHLTAYKRELVTELGGFRGEFDLSQDYDFALRASERAREIVHVPHVCYHWREHAASGSMGGKPDARKSNLAALGDAMRRRNLPAEIIEYPTANRARLKVSQWPRVSVVVPTDSATRAVASLVDLPRRTNYPDLEIVIVTNSRLIAALGSVAPENARVQIVPYDKPFNFSDKCNAGAQAATGTRVIFFNDDVEAEQPDWVQNLIEQLENPGVGAVSPKLLYETGKIQHAGLVTGVRGFAGTAFHQRSGDSTDYFNLAQSLRDVSALSGACLAMRRDDFLRLGGFDAVDTPIAHSDFDLCFRVREAGLRCVYTPFATLRHVGHVSIGTEEREQKVRRVDKANIFLLKRWGGYTTCDPYFPDNMRDWLYSDSPTPLRMSGRNKRHPRASEADLLFVSHDLSWSGAPLILLQMAQWCSNNGFFVVVMSPKDGPLREEFAAAGIPVIVDPLITTGHESFTAFAKDFDCVVASTIFGAPIVQAAKREGIPHFWWIHEGRVAEHYLGGDASMRRAISIADQIVTPDTRSSQVYQPFSDQPIRILPYGIPDPALDGEQPPIGQSGPVKFLLLGTIEHRKGQQVLLDAVRQLPADVVGQCEFRIVGRAHDPEIAQEVAAAAQASPHLTLADAVSPDDALALIASTDVMISASWDETGPLILMEAAALGKALLSTNVGAVAEFLVHGDDALFFQPGDAPALAREIERLVRDRELLKRLGARARRAYEKHFTFARFASEFSELVRGLTRPRALQRDSVAPALQKSE
ncbi:hypothetical protein BH18VER1_BH18VER1_13850 [soil metagenome]